MNAALTTVSKLDRSITCYYANTSQKLQIVRIDTDSKNSFEKVAFPGERLLFNARRDDRLEVYVATDTQPVLSHRIECDRLQIQEPAIA